MFAPQPFNIYGMRGYTTPDAKAVADAFGSAVAAPAPFATALGGLGNNFADAYKSYTQGMGGMGNQRVAAYGAYAGGLGQVANAMGQERQGFYQGNALAEAARQAALGNIGTASLGSYGQAANSALGAWAQNQMAYNQALAGLGQANQTALAGLGSSRNSALGGLGQSYADLGGRLGAASAIGNVNFGFDIGGSGGGGDGFSATGPGGSIASGSYGGGGGGGGMSGFGARTSDTSQLQAIGAPAYRGLDRLQDNLMAGDITGSLNSNYADSVNRLNAQHYSSRAMPSQMLGQTLSGLLAMGRDAYGQIAGGMNQFYGAQNNPANRAQFGDILRGLNAGYGSTARDINEYAGTLGAGYQTANANIGSVAPALRDLWDRSLGNMDTFQSPLDKARKAREGDLYSRGASLRDGMAAELQRREGRDADLTQRLNEQLAAITPYTKDPDQARAAAVAAHEAARRTRDQQDRPYTDPNTFSEFRGLPFYEAQQRFMPTY